MTAPFQAIFNRVAPQQGANRGPAPARKDRRGQSMAQLVRQTNRWRDGFNPLRGLAISRLVTLLEAGERGEYTELQWCYRMIEKRYPVLRALKARRLAALLKMDWEIKVSSRVPRGLENLASEQQQFLREIYNGIFNLTEAIRFLGLAEFRGYSHCVKKRNAAGSIRELHWLPQWNWIRDGRDGDWCYNQDARSTTAAGLTDEVRVGIGLPRDQFVIRECDMPINEIASIAFMSASMAKKDWTAFVEIFGLPNVIIEMPPHLPHGKEEDYEAAAESVAEGGNGAVPNGSRVHFPSAAVRVDSPFKEFLEWEEKDVVLAGTGGKLTMLSEATGIGGSQAKRHGEAFDEVAAAEAAEISETLQKDLDAPELAAAFPGWPVLAYFDLCARPAKDVTRFVDNVLSLRRSGCRVAPRFISERTGIQLLDPTH